MDSGNSTWAGKPYCRGMKGFLHANVPKSYQACEYCGLANPHPQSERLPALNPSVPVIDLVKDDDDDNASVSRRALHSTSSLGFQSINITTAQKARAAAIAQEQLNKIKSTRPNIGSPMLSARPKPTPDVKIKKEKMDTKVKIEKPEEKPDYRLIITFYVQNEDREWYPPSKFNL
jgi:hypothetical protein